MGPFVGQIFLKTVTAGWTMTYYPDGEDYGVCMASMQTINTALMKMLPSGVTPINLRVSDLTAKRDVLNEAPVATSGSYLGSGGPAIPADPSLALVQKFLAGPFHWFNLYIRGVPNTLVSSSDPLTMSWAAGDWDVPYLAWLNAVKTNATGMIKDLGPPIAFTPITITSFIIHPTSKNNPLSIRRAGRPFGLRRGRRAV